MHINIYDWTMDSTIIIYPVSTIEHPHTDTIKYILPKIVYDATHVKWLWAGSQWLGNKHAPNTLPSTQPAHPCNGERSRLSWGLGHEDAGQLWRSTAREHRVRRRHATTEQVTRKKHVHNPTLSLWNVRNNSYGPRVGVKSFCIIIVGHVTFMCLPLGLKFKFNWSCISALSIHWSFKRISAHAQNKVIYTQSNHSHNV